MSASPATAEAGPGETRRPVRTATVSWFNNSPEGKARVGVGSGAFSVVPLAFSGGAADTKVSTPGELLTAAHCGALAMMLALILERRGIEARELTVEGTYTFHSPFYEVTDRSFTVRGWVRGSSPDGFEEAARDALERSAESLGIAGAEGARLTTELLSA
jgi:uncharacterized OsmC-like protein